MIIPFSSPFPSEKELWVNASAFSFFPSFLFGCHFLAHSPTPGSWVPDEPDLPRPPPRQEGSTGPKRQKIGLCRKTERDRQPKRGSARSHHAHMTKRISTSY